MADREPSGLGPFVLATTNPNKAREIKEIFAACGLRAELKARPAELGDVEETEATFLGNARRKARSVVAATGLAAIAEDSGIEVAALGGAPGVRSARYAGEPADDDANVDKVLAELTGLGPSERKARFVTVAVALWPDGREVVSEGEVRGWVAPERRGRGGFGYDPVFVPDEGDGRTFGEIAEVSPEAKHALSHRGRAFRSLASSLSGAEPAPAVPPPTPATVATTPRARRRWVPRTVRRLAEVLIVGFILEYVVVPQIGGTHKALHTLTGANPFLPLAGLVMEVFSLFAYFQLTRGVIPKSSDPGLATVARIELSTMAVSHTVPGGNLVGYSLAYSLLTRAGVSGPDAGVALASQGLGSAVVLNVIFWLALVASLPVYGFQGDYLIAAGLGVLLMLAVAALAVLFTKGDARAEAVLKTLGKRLPFLHPDTLPRLFSNLAQRARELAKDRRQLGIAIAFASANWLFDAGSLFLFVAAFGRWLDPVALLVAYGLANIAGALPITPAGLGVIEGTLSPLLVLFGTPRTIAILGVLAWRLVNFWLPIPLGGLAYLSLRVHPPAGDQAGLAARRAAWKARRRWFAELFERATPDSAIDEGLAVIEGRPGGRNGPPPTSQEPAR